MISSKEETCKQQAISDIKEDLKQECKSFIAYHQELDETMRKLVLSHIRAQKKIKR